MKNKKRPFAMDFSGESKTQQHFKDACDVNNIVAHFRATGIDPYAERLTNQHFGYASSQTFTEAMQNIAQIQTAFAELPSEERSAHQNDPATWLESLAAPPPTQEEGASPIVAPTTTPDVESSETVPPELDSAGT